MTAPSTEHPRLDRLEKKVATLLRLPLGGPEPPPGSGQVQVFRAAPRYLQYNLLRWAVKEAFGFLGLTAGFAFINVLPPELGFLQFFEAFGVLLFLMQLPFSFVVTYLDFSRRWYLVTDRSLRIREGVWTVHERTMSFANVQNLKINQGPIARLLGLATLEVRSAGGGGSEAPGKRSQGQGEDLHIAYFRGVDNAEAIRDLILARLRGMRGAGLGDPGEEQDQVEDAHAHSALERRPALASTSSAAAAARDLLDEARALRLLLGRG